MTNNNFHTNGRPDEPQKHEMIEEGFDLTGLLIDYVNNWKYFLLSLAICLGGAFCYIKTIVPTFRIGAAVYLNDDNATKTSAISMSSESLFDMKSMIDETEIEILKSRNSLLKIVDTLQLAYSYYTVGQWRDVPVYKTNPINARMDSTYLDNLSTTMVIDISKDEQNGYQIKVEYGSDYTATAELAKLPGTISTPAGDVHLSANGDFINEMSKTQRIKIGRPTWAAGRVASSLSVRYAENAATIVNFEYVTPLPAMGTDILQMIIYFYNRQIIEDKNRSAIQTEEFIQARLKDIQDELKGVEENLREYRERHNIVSQDAQISMSLAQQRATETSISDLMSRERLLNDLLAEVNAIEVSPSRVEIMHLPYGFVSNEAVNTSIERFNKNVDLYNAQRSAMTEENETIGRLITTLRDHKNQIIRSLEAYKRQLADQRQSMTTIENRSNSQLAAQPTVDKGLQEIFRDQSVKANIYTFLLQKREEIALQKTLATPTAQFIDNPSVLAQVAPNSVRIYFIGLIIGLLIPAVLIFGKRKLFPKFKDKDDITRMTNVPVIGEICQADVEESEIVIGENVSTSVAELFRLLRNNVNFARTGGEKQVILLTSAISGEGKTFVALNLAMTYALTGKKVVVVGFDIRRPVLAHKLGLSNRVGVTSFLSDQVGDIADIIFPTELNPNLYAIPAGPIPPNPNELLLSDRMDELFNQLRQEFDYIIIDTAPIGMVSDSMLIIPHSDIQLFVTRASYSTRRGIHTLHEAINSGQMEKAYIILNGVNIRSRAYQYRRYGYYHTGGSHTYGYGYKSKSTQTKK